MRAKDLLDDLDVKYKAYELDLRKDGADIQEVLAEMTGQKTVPNIFINKQHVGGCSDLEMAHQSGKLQQLLKNAGIDAKL